LAALAQIPGIGRSKLKRYGSAVIEIVAARRPDRSDPVEPGTATMKRNTEDRAGN
jgi:hypothetical protein